MAGTLRGKIGCVAATGDYINNIQEIFTNWILFMEDLVTANVCQRIALQYGNGGTGTDFHDGGNPFGDNAFAVYRFPPAGSRTKDWYLLGQWSDATNFGTSPGSPGLIGGSAGSSGATFGFAFASALESDGTTNASPWNGDTGNDGGDTKGPVDTVESGPVWAPPAGGSLAVWPISNSVGGAEEADKENTIQIYALSSSDNLDIRYGFLADDDNFFMYGDYGDNLNSVWCWFGPATFKTEVPDPFPFGMVSDNGDLALDGSPYGNLSGVGQRQGGFYADSVEHMLPSYIASLGDALTTSAQPSEIRASDTYEEMPLHFYCDEGIVGRMGMGGTFDINFIRAIAAVADQDTTTSLDRIFIGEVGTTSVHVSVPWDSTTTPGTTAVRGGVDF